MVWFQCEDCGDNLKKPKLPNHFRVCSAFKLSCIDCGQVFSQQDVDTHTQCISEAEKYGPKGQANSNGVNAKPKNDSKQKPEVDINVGLSERPPWFCSLCNTKATSKQTLLLHADGKKHRAKARAIHASKQQPNGAAETNKDSGESRDQNSSKADGSEVQNNDSTLIKKRKVGAAENGGSQNKNGDVGAVTQSNGIEIGVTKGLKKAKHGATQEDEEVDTNIEKDFGNKKIKWKKLITSALKSNPDGALKFKKLLKAAVKSLEESGFTGDNKQVSKVLEQKINSSSRFIVDGKYVRLTTSS